MAESRGRDLRKQGAHRAIAVRGTARVDTQTEALIGGKMADFVNDGGLLRPDQQQHEP